MFANAFKTCLQSGAYLLDETRQTQSVDGLDAVLADNAVLNIAARKNKRLCMTNTCVIHSQSTDSLEYSTFHILARFISFVYPQRVTDIQALRSKDLGSVTHLTTYTY